MVTGLTTSLDVLNLPVSTRVGFIAGATVLAGLIAWASQWEQRGQRREHDGQTDPRVDPSPPRPAQLPPSIAHFTGRRDQLDRLHRLVAARHSARRSRSESASAPLLVCVHGRGGVGKSVLITRFAHQIVDKYPDGQLYFDLRGTGESRVPPEEVLIGFLLALGVRLTTNPGGLPELQKLWWTTTRGRRILIFLDNAHDGEQVQAILPPEPGCAVLATSRQPLHLGSDFDERLTDFPQSQAIELLARLAGDERTAADPDAAAEIVELCDRLPLAVSICGGRLAARQEWSLRDMATRLRDERRRLNHLEVAQRPDRSVRATLQLSYDDCTEPQRRLLRSLTLLSAPDLPTWVAGVLLDMAEPEAEVHMEALVDAQLLEYSGRDATGTMRYRLHDLVRLYGRERAVREDDDARRRAAVERVISGYRDRAERAAADRWPQDWRPQGRDTDEGAHNRGLLAAKWLRSERLAMLTAIDQGVELEAWELVWRLGRAFCSLCHSLRVFWSDWRAVAEITCRAAERRGDERALAVALLERAAVLGGQGGNESARGDAERALMLFERLREPWWAARAHRAIGVNLRDAGNPDEGELHLTTAIAAFHEVGDRWWQARTMRNLAELRLSQGRHADARGLLEQALKVFEQDGNRYSGAQTLRALGEVLAVEAASSTGEEAERAFTKAAFILERAAEIFRLGGETWEEARCLRAAGEVGDPRNGLRELKVVQRAKDMLEGLGDAWGVARALLAEGGALSRLGRVDEAIEVLDQAASSFGRLGDQWLQARCLRVLADVEITAGRGADAQGHASQAVEIYHHLADRSGEARARAVLGAAGAPVPPNRGGGRDAPV